MDQRSSVRATTLQGVMEKIMEKNHHPKSNIPQEHLADSHETRRSVMALQQKLEVLALLRKRSSEVKGEMINKVNALITKVLAEVKQMQLDLAQFKSSGEQWFMIIGDYGGSSFKLMLCDLAAEETNSFQGGFVIGEMMAKDTWHNLNSVFGIYKVCDPCSIWKL